MGGRVRLRRDAQDVEFLRRVRPGDGENAQIAWASERGYRELITWTDTENAATRRVNTKLGYAEKPGPIVVERSL